jgi:hypothetical protein
VFTRVAGGVSHRYIFIVDGNALGQWGVCRGYVAVNGGTYPITIAPPTPIPPRLSPPTQMPQYTHAQAAERA